MKSSSAVFRALSIALLAAVVLYFGVQGCRYLTDPYSTTLAYRSSSEESISLTGWLVRDEEPLQGPSGTLQQMLRDGEKAAAGETVVDAHNLNFHNVPLRKILSDAFPGIPVYIANDANGAALAELYTGAFVGCKTGVLLTLGTGLGGGIILNGKMFNGGMNHGVELGHAYLVDGGEPCTCGNLGCMEAYCAASALTRDGRRAMQAHPESMLAEQTGGDPGKITPKLVTDCAKAGDAAAKAVFDTYLEHLSSACASVYNILDPEVLAIGGGLSAAGPFLFDPLQEKVSKKCFYATRGKLVPAVLGNEAGMVGAALLARDAKV